MANRFNLRLGWLIVLLPLIAGCGGVGKTRVSGVITLDGKPLTIGHIMFTGMEMKSRVAGGKIKDGHYIVNDVAPGMNIITITSKTTPYDNYDWRRDGLPTMGQMKGGGAGGGGGGGGGRMMGGNPMGGMDMSKPPADPLALKEAILAARGVKILVDESTIGARQTQKIGIGRMELDLELTTPPKEKKS
jgi:hypothetical protein